MIDFLYFFFDFVAIKLISIQTRRFGKYLDITLRLIVRIVL